MVTAFLKLIRVVLRCVVYVTLLCRRERMAACVYANLKLSEAPI